MSIGHTMRTRGQIAAAAGRFGDANDTASQTYIKDAMDYAFIDALSLYDWPMLLRIVDIPTAFSGGALTFTLPKDVRNLISVQDTMTLIDLENLSLPALFDQSAGLASISGVATRFALIGKFGISAPLAAPSSLELVSSTADTRKIWIRGFLAGEPANTQVSLTGTTPVAVGSFDEVTQFTADTAALSGPTVTLRIVGGSSVGTLSPGEQTAEYPRYRLWQGAGGPDNITVLYKYTPPAVFADDHIYPLPIDVFLLETAKMAIREKQRQYSDARVHQARAQDSLLRVLSEALSAQTEIAQPRSRGNAVITVVIVK